MKLSLDLLDELVCELKAKNAKAAAPKPPEIDKYTVPQCSARKKAKLRGNILIAHFNFEGASIY